MHHLLPFYGKYQSRFLKTYMALARLVKIPIIGTLVRYIANIYARRQHGGYHIPPSSLDRSTRCTLNPCSAMETAEDIPAIPPPMTSASGMTGTF